MSERRGVDQRYYQLLEFDDYCCVDCGCEVGYADDDSPLATVHYESTNPSPIYSSQAVTLCVDCHKTHHTRPQFIHSGIPWAQGAVIPEVSWETRRRVNEAGYIEVHVDGQRVLEHRLVYMQSIGGEIDSDVHIHHKNGDRFDNRPENLKAVSAEQHRQEHSTESTEEYAWKEPPVLVGEILLERY